MQNTMTPLFFAIESTTTFRKKKNYHPNRQKQGVLGSLEEKGITIRFFLSKTSGSKGSVRFGSEAALIDYNPKINIFIKLKWSKEFLLSFQES